MSYWCMKAEFNKQIIKSKKCGCQEKRAQSHIQVFTTTEQQSHYHIHCMYKSMVQLHC